MENFVSDFLQFSSAITNVITKFLIFERRLAYFFEIFKKFSYFLGFL